MFHLRRPLSPLPSNLLELTSDVWASLPLQLSGEVAMHLPSVTTSLRRLISCSHTNKLWRKRLSPYIFDHVVVRVLRGDPRAEDLFDSTDSQHLRRFLETLDENPEFAQYIKHLTLLDSYCPSVIEWDISEDDIYWDNAELLVDVFQHFPHLDRLEFSTLLCFDPNAIPEIMARGYTPSSNPHTQASENTAPLRPTDAEYVYVEFSDNMSPWSASVPRFIGLLSLFGEVGELETLDYDDFWMEFEDEVDVPFPTQLQLSKLKVQGSSSYPSVLGALISPEITSNLTYFDGLSLSRDLEELREVFMQPDLDPEHLVINVNQPLPLETETLDLSSKPTTRLKELTVHLAFVVPHTDVPGVVFPFDGHGPDIQCATTLLATLHKPRTYTLQKLNIHITGMQHAREPSIQPRFINLDSLLFALYTGGIPVAIQLESTTAYRLERCALNQFSELFPRCQVLEESLQA